MLLICICFFEVCITDIMETSGQRIELELSQRFSRDDVMFVKCDVTSKDQMQGWQTEHHTYVIYKIINLVYSPICTVPMGH